MGCCRQVHFAGSRRRPPLQAGAPLGERPRGGGRVGRDDDHPDAHVQRAFELGRRNAADRRDQAEDRLGVTRSPISAAASQGGVLFLYWFSLVRCCAPHGHTQGRHKDSLSQSANMPAHAAGLRVLNSHDIRARDRVLERQLSSVLGSKTLLRGFSRNRSGNLHLDH